MITGKKMARHHYGSQKYSAKDEERRKHTKTCAYASLANTFYSKLLNSMQNCPKF